MVTVLVLSLAVMPVGQAKAAPESEVSEIEAAAASAPAAPDAAAESGSIADSDIAVTNEMIVVYDDAGVTEAKSEKIKAQAEEALSGIDAEVTDEVAEPNEQQGTVVVAEIPEDVKIEEAIAQIEADDNVSFAQPNFVYSALEDVQPLEDMRENTGIEEQNADGLSDDGIEEQSRTNDALYNSQVDVYGSQYLNYLSASRVYEAWDSVQTDKSVTVAVLDSGCRLDHEDLQNNILKNYAYDSYYNRPLTAGTVPNGGDATGHGTHVCGLIAAEADNGIGIAGTSYNASIIPVKIFDNFGGGATTATFMKGIEYCRQLIESGKVDNLRIMNMSVGYYSNGSKGSVDRLLENMIGIMADYYDVLCVCSGGNGDNRSTPYVAPMYPSDFEDCLSVTALDAENYNCRWSDYNAAKDISAPGEAIVSTYFSSKNSYAHLNGTSMAAPIVSGICALLFAENPSLTVDEVVEAVEVTANSDIVKYRNESTDADRKAESGSHGAIDAKAALDYVSDRSTASGDASIEYAQITGVDASYEYTGGKIRPVPTVRISGVKLKKNSDYTVTYSNNTSVSTSSSKAMVIIEGIGGYHGTVVKTFTITPRDISKCAVTLSGTKFAYTGSAVNPAVTVCVSSENSMRLKKDIDYTVTYARNVEPGTATVTVKATGGSYKGSVVKNYTITKADIASLAASVSPSSYTYNKKARKPKVTVRNGQVTLAKGKDYTVSYANNVKAGRAVVKITGKGSHYTGTVTKNFNINPKGTSLSKLGKKSKGFIARWKKQANQTTGYQIQYSMNKDFGKAKTKTVNKAKSTEASISGLKKGTVYYVRIRTYKKSGGKKCCSAWSKVKKVKTK